MEHYKFFQHNECEFFPCHNTTNLNCKFCFCPLYHIQCEGDFKVLSNGVKDCSDCLIPHSNDSWDKIINKLNSITYYECDGG